MTRTRCYLVSQWLNLWLGLEFGNSPSRFSAFSCVFSTTRELSRTLTTFNAIQKVLKKKRSDESFDEFWDLLLTITYSLVILIEVSGFRRLTLKNLKVGKRVRYSWIPVATTQSWVITQLYLYLSIILQTFRPVRLYVMSKLKPFFP